MKVIDAQVPVDVNHEFAQEIKKRSGENVFLCYQCHKCASGCPARDFMDSTPDQLMRYAQLGLASKCMKGNTIWYCSSCQTCSTRCPAGIDIARVISTIKIMTQERGVGADTMHAGLFNNLWMRTLKYTGRIYEAGVIGLLNLGSGRPLNDAGLAIKMLRRGKLKLIPPVTRPAAMMRMFNRAKRAKL